MRLNWRKTLGAVALLSMSVPVWAKTDSIDYVIDHPMTIAGHQLSAGTYKISANETGNEVQVKKDGDVVATVPCQWIQLPAKARADQVVENGSQVTELQFSGKTQAATFTNN